MDFFSLQKLKTLPSKTALRKIINILQKLEIELALKKQAVQTELLFTYLRDLVLLLEEKDFLGEKIEAFNKDFLFKNELSEKELLYNMNRLRHFLKNYLGISCADWDLLDLNTGYLDPAARKVFPIKIYLEDLRSPYNLGSIFRSAEAFGVAEIILSPFSVTPTHPRALKTARGADKVLKWSIQDLSSLTKLGPVFALETGGTTLAKFSFPPKGTVLIGSEELGLSSQALELACSSAGLVSIPQYGAKRSLNVAVACGILLEHWSSYLIQCSC